jgi:hypothetical protein
MRHAESAWQAVIRPWLEGGRGRLERSYVIVASRGQAHGLKQRCLAEKVALLGVEFLTPGLARQKWTARQAGTTPSIGRELLLLGLRTLVERRLRATTPEEPEWGFWKSLQSDAERALDDFDEILKAGLSAEDFPSEPLRTVLVELVAWVIARGYRLSAVEAKQAALGPLSETTVPIAGRVLVAGLGVEMWGEFFNVWAFVRRCEEATVILPEPEFREGSAHDERWVELWEQLLGTDGLSIDADEPAKTCEAVGAIWGRQRHEAAPSTQVLVGRTRADEMHLVAAEIARLLDEGAENIAVIFPRADAGHLQLTRELAGRGVMFADLLEAAAPPPVEVQAQRALLRFYERGARVEDLLRLWPLLRALGVVTLSLAEARRACERSFDTRQTHAVSAHLALWAEQAPELARVAGVLLPAWPEEWSVADALQSFRQTCEKLGLEEPEGWGALDAFARRDPDLVPARVLVATLSSFLPDRSPVLGNPGRGGFARVTLTTRRRAEGLAWSHLILVEANAGVWPERREPSGWLTDPQRAELNARSDRLFGFFTADDRSVVERAAFVSLTRDTTAEVVFSAALFAPEEPELRLAPNSWLERVMWAQKGVEEGATVEGEFGRLARAVPVDPPADPAMVENWHEVWLGRRDQLRPFDEFFFSGDPARITPAKLSARLIERGVQDPAELWFEAVLGIRRVEWSPFLRARRKALGQRAHELLARVLHPGDETVRGFGRMPDQLEAGLRLERELAVMRAQWPDDRYWDSFQAELAHVSRALLANAYTIEAGAYVAAEAWLPPEAKLVWGDREMRIVGRLDLIRLDRAEWSGATIDIVDFKTGGDAELSAERMARSGASLQLGVYLAAARSLGIAGGKVWMIKPEPGAVTQLGFVDMSVALTKLNWLEDAVTRGVYGALTRDRSDYAPSGCAWPLACTPISSVVLEKKFQVTFGGQTEEARHE